MFKKLISFVLIVSMVLLISLIPVSANTTEHTYPMPDEKEGRTTIFYEENGWTVYYHSYMGVNLADTLRVGKYVFYKGVDLPYYVGIYLEKDGVILYLNEAYESGEIKDLDALIQSLLMAKEKGAYIPMSISISGDADYDWEITVADVLEIQRHLADLKEATGTEYWDPAKWEQYFFSFDYDLDGEPTISDALSIQKDLAEI